MHISIDNIKTTAFVIKNKFRGYKLLKNPKGVSPNDVTMIKTWFGFHPDYYDKYYHYHEIHRYKDGDKFVKDKTSIMTEYIMDPITKKYSGKNKNISLAYESETGKSIYKQREYMSIEDMEKRPYPEWRDVNEEYDFGEELFVQNSEDGGSPSNFWSVLKANLNNGKVE